MSVIIDDFGTTGRVLTWTSLCRVLILSKTVTVLTRSEIEARGSHRVRICVQLALLGSWVAATVIALWNTHLIRCTTWPDLLREVRSLLRAISAPHSGRLWTLNTSKSCCIWSTCSRRLLCIKHFRRGQWNRSIVSALISKQLFLIFWIAETWERMFVQVGLRLNYWKITDHSLSVCYVFVKSV